MKIYRRTDVQKEFKNIPEVQEWSPEYLDLSDSNIKEQTILETFWIELMPSWYWKFYCILSSAKELWM